MHLNKYSHKDKEEENDDGKAGAPHQLQKHISEGDQAAYVPRLPFKKPLPQQNIDLKNPKPDKTITEELLEGECKRKKASGRPYLSCPHISHS